MPQKIIEVPGFGDVEFPDSMTDDQIVAAIKAQGMSTPPAPEPAPQAQPGMMQQALGMVTDLGKGLAKSVAGAVEGGGKMVRSIPGIGPLLAAGPEVTLPMSTTPSNTTQQVGKTVGDIAAFMAPGTAIGKVAGGSKVVRGALEALSAAGITKAQGGDPLSAAVTSGAFSAAAPVGAKIVEKLPSAILNNMLRTPAKAYSFGKNPGAAIAEEGVVAPTIGMLVKKLKTVRGGIGAQIDATLLAAKNAKSIDIKTLLSPIDDGIKAATDNNDQALLKELRRFKDSITDVMVEDSHGNLVKSGVKKPSVLRPYDANLEKRRIGKGTQWTGTVAYEKTLNQVKAKVYRNIDAAIDKEVGPKVADLNRRYGNILEAEKTAKRSEGMNFFRLSDFLAGAGLIHSVPGGSLLIAGKKAVETTAGATAAAQVVKKLPAMAPAARASVLAGLSKSNAGETQ